jgi:hypothetical protein
VDNEIRKGNKIFTERKRKKMKRKIEGRRDQTRIIVDLK